MEYYFAPLEGITGYIYRNAHHAFFPSIDRYFTPFITPKQGKSFTAREWNDILPEHNEGMEVVPQILTNQAEGFLKVADRLAELGYGEVNLNLGCPSATVVTKHKGAGFLEQPQQLAAFLDEIFGGCRIKVSIKTRIGRYEPEEFAGLLEIFNRYPLQELIIHPRTREEFYKGQVHMEIFAQALAESKNPVCYNGDLLNREKMETFTAQFPEVERVMLGRGLLVNPTLAAGSRPDPVQLKAFHDRLVADYSEVLSGERDVLFKMKELWFYLGRLFADSEKEVKKIRKAQRLSEYRIAVAEIFANCRIEEPQDGKLYF